VSGAGAGVSGLQDARRWRDRLERAWGLTLHDSVAPSRLHLPGFVGELEQGLGLIDFPEVTVEDRITFLEAAVAWQVRRALRAGRFDLAIRIQAFGAKRVMELHESQYGWRPVLLYGVPRPDRPPRLTS